MNKTLPWVCGVVLGLIALPAIAQTKSDTLIFDLNPEWLGIGRGNEVEVSISDQVSDGCWTNTSLAKTAVELELKRSGFKIASKEGFPKLTVRLTAVGYKTTGCTVSNLTEVSVVSHRNFYKDGHRLSGMGYYPLWKTFGVLTGSDSNERLKNAFVNDIQEFLNLIDKRQKDVLTAAKKDAPSADAKAFWASVEAR